MGAPKTLMVPSRLTIRSTPGAPEIDLQWGYPTSISMIDLEVQGLGGVRGLGFCRFRG